MSLLYFNFQNISLQKKVFKAESFKVEDWNVSYFTSSSKKLSQFTRMLYNNVELFVQQQFPYWEQLWFIFHLIFFSKHLKLIGIRFTVYEGSTKADFTLPKNFLFYADPFSTAERESDFFSDISKIFYRYSSWSISPIHMFIDIHQYYFF